MIFWLMTASHRVGIVDGLDSRTVHGFVTGTLLGQQALIFCITAFWF